MSVGYLACRGNTDLSVVIRTAIVAGGRVMVQLGAGIVSDSEPAAEWAKTVAKGLDRVRSPTRKRRLRRALNTPETVRRSRLNAFFDAAQKRAPWREAVVTAVSFM